MNKIFITLFVLMSLPFFAQDSQKPNIIVFLTDDQAFTTIGAYGNPQVKTPNIDNLVEQGISFRNNYATTSICMASRATIMTGMYEYKTGCNFKHGPLHKSKFKKSYPVLLREAGYYTGFAGKFGFAVVDKGVTSTDDKTYDELPVDKFDWWAGGIGQTMYETAKNKYITQYADKYPHSTRAYGAACSDFIKEASGTGKPFCLSMSFKAGHKPNKPDPFFDDVYANTDWKKPDNFGRENANHLSLQARLGRQYLNFYNSFGYSNDYQNSIRKYQQLIHGVDYAVGMILEELERQGIADNTIIIFTSDNGYNCGSHGFGGKVLPYEEGSRTPLIMYDPRNKTAGGKWTNAVAGNIDIAPTVLEYAGLSIPKNMDGKSLVKVVNNPAKSVRKALPLIQAWGTAPSFALTMVSEDYKYIYWPYAEKTKASEELFFLKNDPNEMHNVFQNKEHKKGLKKLKKQYAIELKNWKDNAVKGANYQEFSVIFDPNSPWHKKKNIIPEVFNETYQKELKNAGYKGDIYNYESIINHVKTFKPEQN